MEMKNGACNTATLPGVFVHGCLKSVQMKPSAESAKVAQGSISQSNSTVLLYYREFFDQLVHPLLPTCVSTELLVKAAAQKY